MKKITFMRIDNGYRAAADYQCSNGLLIVGDNYVEDGGYKYYVGNKGFHTLKEAKEFCDINMDLVKEVINERPHTEMYKKASDEARKEWYKFIEATIKQSSATFAQTLRSLGAEESFIEDCLN